MITLGVYLVGSGLTAATPNGGMWFIFLYATRVIAGMGIGGEYAAINSAIDEMIPAKYRGRIDLAVNGTYWAGALVGTAVTLFVLNHVAAFWGWRVAYLAGPVLALCIIYVRRNLPESPRWQIMHGRQDQAEASIRDIEQQVAPDQARSAAAGRREQGTGDPPGRRGSATSRCCGRCSGSTPRARYSPPR